MGQVFLELLDRLFRICGEAIEETTSKCKDSARSETPAARCSPAQLSEKDGLGNGTATKIQRDTNFPKEVASYHLVDQEIRQVSFKPDLIKE